FPDLREVSAGALDLLDDVTDTAGAVAVTADGLGPQAKRAARAAAAARVQREVRMEQVPDRVSLDVQVPVVHVDDEWQLVHVLEDRPVGRLANPALGPVAQPENRGEGPVLGDFLDRQVELVARDEFNRL